uniref:Sugar phosphate transporter domain-containing protein n=1 Tax=Spongospora subterranea TaxID=70186 RepID=A0A0H5QFE6_9EUKA|eukprot:CRZ00773.1 hypothetical protein [Spongospora subterranea]
MATSREGQAAGVARLSLRRSKSFLDRALFRAITFVFLGCALNNVSLELLINSDLGIGNTITASQFVFISLFGLITHLQYRDGSLYLQERRSPIGFFFKTTSVFVIVSLINNVVFIFNISIPFHMLFRSCSLVVSMGLGLFVYKKQYTKHQIISCLLITTGVLVATLADSVVQSNCCDAPGVHLDSGRSPGTDHWKGILPWMLGVTLLLISLILSSILGHWQEWGYQQYGRYPQENMFYSHLFSLPFFLFLAPDIISRLPALITRSTDVYIPYLNIPLPYSLILAGNIVSQYICVRGVHDVTCLSTTLTCTFTLTIRKFVSLLISVVFLGNTLTLFHWIGAILVFAGTILYSLPRKLLMHDREKVE